MKLFGPLHLGLLAAIIAAAIAAAVLQRRHRIQARVFRLALGWAIAANELIWWVYRYSHEGIHATNLPLQLCDLSVWLAVLACLTLRPAIVEFAYFAGLAGAGMALATPDLYRQWPNYPAVYFFLAHGGVVVAVTMLAFGRAVQFRKHAVWRAYALLLVYAAAVGALNAVAGSNYVYLCRKPASASALDAMGPWPWYIPAGAGLALALFWLLWIPVGPRAHKPGCHVSTRNAS
jgi:hypothetical integral membrane protein (TIGR02206 family)